MDNESPFVSHTAPVGYGFLKNDTAIELSHVTKRLAGKTVLNDLDLIVKKGETHTIIGGSGAGKSVTLKTIIGLVKPDKGMIVVDGLEMTRANEEVLEKIRQKIGFLFQGAALLNSINVYENIALPLREHSELNEAEIKAIVMEKLTLVGLPDCGEKMPSMLSGGMKKRVGLARAIVRNPQIVLYDEPTSGLDPISSRSIENLIGDMQAKLGITSIVVNHDMESAFRSSDRVSMLYNGKILLTAPPAEFKSSENPLIKRFINGEIND